MSASLQELSYYAKSKDDLYYGLAGTYYLPKLSSKSVTMDYLREISKSNSQFLKVPVEEIRPMNLEFKKIGVDDVIERLNNHLVTNGYKPTGFDSLHLPDVQWVADICRWADPSDQLKVFKKPVPMEATLKRELDPKYFKKK